ncbi:hypothetical protein C2869_05975 [Saccharobesus litoralis]|uniref:Flagellar M-ring N-terminal domain-containing protein n=1 Tax=Saccharobesus litoralis TaxID=2172099 RepID=A0A2S0VP95_9ALTE|nr:hypothetical protein [Saccharobesus litoralis]AWB66013.1 hypothetical protein C2869_05975 [Saccharobesus litoralis]
MKNKSKYIYLSYGLIAFLFIAAWFSDSTVYKPLVSDLTKSNAVKIVNSLEANDISYKINTSESILFVPASEYQTALGALNKLHIDETTQPISGNIESLINSPIKFYEQTWFIHFYKLFGCLIFAMVVVLAIVRPLLRHEIYGES